MKNIKIIFALLLLMCCSFSPVLAKQKKEDDSYKIQYMNYDWWQTYKDETLVNYMQQAYKYNQDLKISALKTKQAEQVVKQSFATELPHLSFYGDLYRDFSASDVRFGDVIIHDYNQSNFVLPLTMTYEADI